MLRLSFPATSPKSFGLAATVAKVVELTDLKMVGGEFGFDRAKNVDPAEIPDEAPYQFGFQTRYEEKENRLEILITIKGHGIRNATGEGAGDLGLHVEAVFHLTYQVMVESPPEDKREEFFTAFAQINGLMNAWPYYREFAHEAARRMGYPTVIVPLLRVDPPSEAKAKSDSIKANNTKGLGVKSDIKSRRHRKE